MKYPKVTFMTASYNDKFMIETTIKSILEQDYPNFEHIIMDAESKDGTVDMIKKYEPLYLAKEGAELKWFSKKDNGIYDAYNQILDIATGDYLIICADPLYESSTTKKMIDKILSEDYDCCVGQLVVIDSNCNIIRKFSGKIGHIKYGWIPAIPTLMLNKRVFEKYGKYNQNFDTATDYEFAIRIFKDGKIKCVSIQEPLVLYYAGGVSNGTLKGNLEGLKWGTKALIHNGIKFPIIVDIFRIIRSLWQYRYKILRQKYEA